MNRVLVRKTVAVMEPCQTCGATAYEGCKMEEMAGHSLDACSYYKPQRG